VTPDQRAMISTDPRVMQGQAVITGTRVPVSMILDKLAAGLTPEQITIEFPAVSVEGVRAAVAYGAALAREGQHAPAASEPNIRVRRDSASASTPAGPPAPARPTTLRRRVMAVLETLRREFGNWPAIHGPRDPD